MHPFHSCVKSADIKIISEFYLFFFLLLRCDQNSTSNFSQIVKSSKMIPPTPRRKKWTEEEERTLINKYGEMLHNGTLSKMKTREKKFRPIAAQKIKKPREEIIDTANNHNHNEEVDDEILDIEEFDWGEGLTHWPNFLRYKNVFGDVALGGFSGHQNNNNNIVGNELMIRVENGRNYSRSIVDVSRFGNLGEDGFGVGIDDVGENGVLGLGLGGFDYDGEEGDGRNDMNGNVKENGGGDRYEYEEFGYMSRKKRKKLKGTDKKIWGFLNSQFVKLREREAPYEDREAERERERQRREQIRLEHEQERDRRLMEREREKEREDRERSREKMRRERIREWEAMENESIERERRRREEELVMEREWEERMQRRRLDWKKRMDGMLTQHRIAMDQMQTRILHDQQTVTNQLLGILSHWTGHSHGLPDHTGSGNAYLSQMIQNLHPVNGIVHGENRVEVDNQDDQYIVDG
ncbi:SAFB-like transcription modulator [Papaver somniferum]|uniref:SAFB-like transcription modulator n=1 Tax=Papaver somniferum TaxID=3469 RepID=UPI000E6F7970|nr:SAFB-like transcription modulator [Papaver somniferum]